MKTNAEWITPSVEYEKDSAVIFYKDLTLKGKIKKAVLTVSALGAYEARINGERIGDYILAPGWTEYIYRIQYQTYDITGMLRKKSTLEIEVGNGWMRGKIARVTPNQKPTPCGTIAQIDIEYQDGTAETVLTDGTWKTKKSQVYFSDIYDGECCDARINDKNPAPAKVLKWSKKLLVPQEGEKITEHEILRPVLFTAPNGEKILDFGQNMTGYVKIELDAHEGDRIVLDCGEVLDNDGNFYRENYRDAKTVIDYICHEGHNVYKPRFSFMAFRYIRILKHPSRKIQPNEFLGICVYSDIRRTGHLECSSKILNRLFENIFWGQKDNYLDVPTDCPQRNERMGWTGDAQVFARTASYNYDVEKFFKKWLHDLYLASDERGRVPKMVPYTWQGESEAYANSHLENSPAWGDAATVCPWEMYLTYGNKQFLKDQFESMRGWVDYMTARTTEKYLFSGGFQYGDWLGIDAPAGSYRGASSGDLIGAAFYAYSTGILIKAGKILGKDMSEYEKLRKNTVKAFRKKWPEYKTQTEHVLALHFGLAENPEKTAASLADMIRKNGNKLTTGFVGTPYLLHALSENGYADLAYTLLLQEEYPSWLFSVKMGATTMWEHWDGKKADGSFWSTNMNSFNHYAYGAVGDWVYGVAAGINRVEEKPGFEEIVIKPIPDKRLGWLSASIDTKCGTVSSKWIYEGEYIRYEITTPSPTTIIIGDKTYNVDMGTYIYNEVIK